MMKFIKPLISIFFLAILFNGNAQGEFDPVKFKESLKTASFREKFEAGNLLMEDQMYMFAADIWKALAEEQPDNANVNYKAGVCLLHLSNERANALPYLKKAESGISKKYNPFSHTETKAPFETHFYLGRAHHLNENLDEATTNFQLFLNDVSKKHKLFDETNLYLKHVEVAKVEIPDPKEYTITNVGNIINGEYEDFSPVVTLDEGAMFFTSRRLRPDSSNKKNFSPQDGMHYEDVYVSYYDFANKKWNDPEVITTISSRKSNQATISVSGDGQQLFIYKDIKGNGEIYMAEYEGDNYGTPTKLGSDINTPSWETHATVSLDGKTLYFVSDREGGLGGRDIYRCKKLPNGEWSKAFNVGAPINTENDEDSPYLHPDGTMYFSSNGVTSIGGFDIYSTKPFTDENGKVSWLAPSNMGYPLNTVDDDVFFTTNAKGDKGYYSSAKKGGFGQKDIYEISFQSTVENFAILKGYIDPGTGKQLPDNILILVTDLTEGGDPQEYTPNKRNGSYIFNLKPCNEYLVEYTLKGETFYETEFDVPCDANYNETNIVLNMDGVRLDGEDVPVDTVAVPEEKAKWKYQLLVGGKPYLKTGLIEFLDGEIVEFDELLDENGYFQYKELKSKHNPIFSVKIEDPNLCDQMIIKLFDENNNLVREIKRDVRCKTDALTYEPVVYQRFYGYNLKGVDSEEKQWDDYYKGVVDLIEKRGFAKVEIEGSASYVPTKTWKTNTILAKKRTEDGKKMLIAELKKRNIDASKVKIIITNSIVQGPKYKKDFKNTEKYGKYQYLKMKAY